MSLPATAGAPTRPVYIAGIGHCSARGLDAESAATAILAGDHACTRRELLGARHPWFALPLAEADWTARARAAVQAVGSQLTAGLAPERVARLPLFIGSSSLQAGAIETAARQRGRVDMPPDAAAFAADIAAWLGVAGTPWTFSTSCTSGVAALDAARTLIAAGLLDEALVLGFEFANDTTLAGFAGLGILAETPEADGLVLGEAIAGVLLSAAPQAGWRIAACRLGVDGHAATAPAPDGKVIEAIIAAALADAGLAPQDIDLIKPHRGRLASTDEAEAAALARLFGTRHLPEIALKRQLGHTLGASGPAELTALLAMLDHPAGRARHGTPQRLLLDLIGFGGSIAALVVTRSSEPAQAVA
ncbi:hypothetical protein CJ010_01785 [Azoarcus sp. DD4]|uniref:beta-ketoacyl synthase N-terminal-like domain-containing protein n=1 Tax=Azoarcus sp. DD4 TaxID=2027405 RepID=UPI00112EAB0F|nr:beta-ketoacyl synthase N-terminal-like domain-containing protein [Azoarcus sp. DD4]QDF95371.1 hypothetical protein CJ010_01785 [Azoarcus sp. DD4]